MRFSHTLSMFCTWDNFYKFDLLVWSHVLKFIKLWIWVVTELVLDHRL